MNVILITNDFYLVKAFESIFDNLLWIPRDSILTYLSYSSTDRSLVLIDERIEKILILKIKNRNRHNDITARLCFSDSFELGIKYDIDLNMHDSIDKITRKLSRVYLIKKYRMKSLNSNDYFTERELLILILIISGKKTRQIALSLGIDTKTVYCHRSNISKKFGFNNFIVFYNQVICINGGNRHLTPIDVKPLCTENIMNTASN